MSLDNNNHSTVVSYLRDGNVPKYLSVLSDDEVLSILLSRDKVSVNTEQQEFKEEFKNFQNEKGRKTILNAFADVLQAATTEALFTHEILEMIYDRFSKKEDILKPDADVDLDDSVIDYLGKFIKIVHASDYKINLKNKSKSSISFKDTPFALHIEIPEKLALGKYKHYSSYGLFNTNIISRIYKAANNDIDSNIDNLSSLLIQQIEKFYIEEKSIQESDIPLFSPIYSVDHIVNRKIGSADIKKEDDISIIRNKSDLTFVNETDRNNYLIHSKKKPSLSYILIDHPDLRIGTRNSIELATFFNSLSTI